jgi:Bacterial transcriptional activator domain
MANTENIKFGILGSTALYANNEVNHRWGAPRLCAMLATLLVHAGRPVRQDTLVAWVWTEEANLPQCPESTFHTYATRIRNSLAQLPGSSTIMVDNGAYRLMVDRSTIDYYRFQDLTWQAREHARAGDFRGAAECAGTAVGLWRGRALEDLESEPARAWRTRVQSSELLPANLILIQALLELDEPGEVLARLSDLQHEYPTSVMLAKCHLSALHRMSRYNEAAAHYLDTRRLLRDEANDQGALDLQQHYERLRQLRAPIAIQLRPSAGAQQMNSVAADVLTGRVALDAAIAKLQHQVDEAQAVLRNVEANLVALRSQASRGILAG